MRIFLTHNHPVMAFAAAELARVLQRMSGETPEVILEPRQTAPPGGLWLGLLHDFGLDGRFRGRDLALDDQVYAHVSDGDGMIAGSNPRSLLLAVYRFLTLAGCRWVRPGPEGEIVPRRELRTLHVLLDEMAAHRQRTLCLDGAASLRNVLDLVDWAPKLGFSGYFLPFRDGYPFFERWYAHAANPRLPAEPFSAGQAQEYTRRVTTELHRRGMQVQTAGFGWVSAAAGLPQPGQPPREGGAPGPVVEETSLCYSDAVVQARIAAEVAAYALAQPEVDLVHVWLDGGFNNKCGCPRCRGQRPAEDYLQILNQVDARLSERGSRQRIGLLASQDFLWPPKKIRLRHPERFILLYAPPGRPYRSSFENVQVALPPAAGPFRRNRLQLPATLPANLALLRGWQAAFGGEIALFESYLAPRAPFTYDPDHIRLARLLHQDICALRGLGLAGLVSRQVQRVFLPHSLAMTVMGRTLWNPESDFSELVADYFSAAFGPDGHQAQAFLEAMGQLLDLTWLQAGAQQLQPADLAGRVEKARLVIRHFAEIIEHNHGRSEPAQARSWEYLGWHSQILQCFCGLLQACVENVPDEVVGWWHCLRDFIQENELPLQPVLDVAAFIATYQHLESAE